MKVKVLLGSAVVLCAVSAAPAFAQSRMAEADFQYFLAHHPEVRENPGLMSNPAYLQAHPALAEFLRTHPGVHRQAIEMGEYDEHHDWHDRDWWVDHHREWVEQHHPNWLHQEPDSR